MAHTHASPSPSFFQGTPHAFHLPWSYTPQKGMLAKYGIELIGAKLPSIDRAEDRELFKQAMIKIGLKVPMSGAHDATARACVAFVTGFLLARVQGSGEGWLD